MTQVGLLNKTSEDHMSGGKIEDIGTESLSAVTHSRSLGVRVRGRGLERIKKQGLVGRNR